MNNIVYESRSQRERREEIERREGKSFSPPELQNTEEYEERNNN